MKKIAARLRHGDLLHSAKMRQQREEKIMLQIFENGLCEIQRTQVVDQTIICTYFTFVSVGRNPDFSPLFQYNLRN